MIKASKLTEEAIPGMTRFGAVNSRVYEDMADRFKITGWPWVSCFFNGEKVDDMAGLGGADSVVNWAKRKVEDTKPTGGVSRFSDDFVVKPPWSPDGADGADGAEGDDEGSCGLVKEECAGGAAASWADLGARAVSYNVLTKDALAALNTKIEMKTSTEADEMAALQALLQPIDDAIAAAGSSGSSGSNSGNSGNSGSRSSSSNRGSNSGNRALDRNRIGLNNSSSDRDHRPASCRGSRTATQTS